MTPLEIEILFHYHTSPGDYRDGDFSAPAVSDAIKNFCHLGLFEPEAGVTLEKVKRSYRLTDRADAYLAHLMTVPLPVQIWVMPKHEVDPA